MQYRNVSSNVNAGGGVRALLYSRDDVKQGSIRHEAIVPSMIQILQTTKLYIRVQVIFFNFTFYDSQKTRNFYYSLASQNESVYIVKKYVTMIHGGK